MLKIILYAYIFQLTLVNKINKMGDKNNIKKERNIIYNLRKTQTLQV